MDIGDKFKLQASFARGNCDNPISSSVTDVEVEKTIVTGNSAQYSVYCVDFTLSAAGFTSGDILALRLRRIAASSSEVTNEIAIFDWSLNFKRDKIGVKFS